MLPRSSSRLGNSNAYPEPGEILEAAKAGGPKSVDTLSACPAENPR